MHVDLEAPYLENKALSLWETSIYVERTIKQRMQVINDSRSTSFKCFRIVVKSTGFSTLYRAYFTQLALNVPFQCVHFVTYEFLQHKLNPDKQYNPWTHIVSGGIAGGTAAAITTPMDVCKTVLNTQYWKLNTGKKHKNHFKINCLNQTHDIVDGKLTAVPANGRPIVGNKISVTVPSKAVTTTATVVLKNSPLDKGEIRGLFGAAQAVLETQGFLGLFRGMKARVVAILPGTAISWSIYEYFKWMLSRRNASGVPKNPEQQTDTWA
ncbi:hypothetical protein ACTXT7_016023 [Hymenolepis weldensis]